MTPTRAPHPVTIALDAMGCDAGPDECLKGAFDAVTAHAHLNVLLCGPTDVLWPRLKKLGLEHTRLTVEHASQTVTMDEAGTEALRKKDSSVAVAARLAKEGRAAGMVSPGNTGATMATAFKLWGRLPGISRPAIAAIMPHPTRPCVLLDAGANVDCKALHLFHFALMGSVYSHCVFHRRTPRVGLLSNGEEPGKGDALTLAAHELLAGAPIHFGGNAEGRDLMKGTFDVVVCDGFVGNVVLKACEGLAEFIMTGLKEQVMAGGMVTRLGALAMKPALTSFKKQVDYAEFGGAPLLGLNGTCVICHGSSKAKAIMNALRVASELVSSRVNGRIIELLESVPAGGGAN